eukprot:CAMPEP_0181118018 /NCGR_PEP_ID=MMETSP1071-20121207/22848_1 /TAXON_ID=35127 /ORGANISM="Thalassiosira sp., Strain NH16" /LENGTH=408 /DNA_ID=CAMNT_0023202477 /DNA_START=100 /DNA_END=1323 /DNA_ORIENTATION=+
MLGRSRALLQKAAAEASTAAKEAAKAAAASGNGNGGACPQTNSPSTAPPTTHPAQQPRILLYHHDQPNLLLYRRPGSMSYFLHHASSAFGAIVSLCASQESRDRFLSLTGTHSKDDANSSDENDDGGYAGGSIIITSVIGQSDMGFLKPLTLYQDLDDPLYERNAQFNLHEFMDGCGWALGHFHRTKDELLPKLTQFFEEERRGVLNDANENNSTEKDAPVVADFLDIARKDPDSLENTFLAMTTPEVLNQLRLDSFMLSILGGMGGDDKAGKSLSIVGSPEGGEEQPKSHANNRVIAEDTKVMNVALLGARVEEIHPPVPSDQIQKKEDSDPNEPLEDDSLAPDRIGRNSGGDESKPQVVTQLEVLYELQQSSVNDEGKVHTQTSVMVGKFETCLDGDPNRNDNLQW